MNSLEGSSGTSQQPENAAGIAWHDGFYVNTLQDSGHSSTVTSHLLKRVTAVPTGKQQLLDTAARSPACLPTCGHSRHSPLSAPPLLSPQPSSLPR